MQKEHTSIIGTAAELTGNIDWNYWKQISRVHLWVGVALACNINPFKITYATEKNNGYNLNVNDISSEKTKVLFQAISICISNFRRIGIVGEPLAYNALHTLIVDLRGVVKFAREQKWNCSNEFFELSPAPKPSKTVVDEKCDLVNDPRERKSYLRIMKALAELAKLDILTESYKAAEIIEAQIRHQDGKLSKNCIGNKLKEIKESLSPKKST